jgi:succinate dehydrogenase flavin-adding protein (antitoxin of CptAB toxin-antitoxin module)
MLELDLALSAFLERDFDGLDAGTCEAFSGLLGRGDPELLDLIMGREEPASAEEREVLALIRSGSWNSLQHSFEG